MTFLLEARTIDKRFGGLQALAGVSLSILKGEIYGLIGPNGAGKTSFFNALTGIHPPDAGEFLLDGAPLPTTRPQAVVARGIARTFQNIRLFPGMTCLENLLIAQHAPLMAASVYGVGALLGMPGFRAAERTAIDTACRWLEKVGLLARADDAAGELPYGDQRR
ncbi:MAG TPA: ATP-binding cassette domain-containing protein, partial [Thauera sp.]|nr:ATP-binding cassette domain-containing protein [Thauera sp.]